MMDYVKMLDNININLNLMPLQQKTEEPLLKSYLDLISEPTPILPILKITSLFTCRLRPKVTILIVDKFPSDMTLLKTILLTELELTKDQPLFNPELFQNGILNSFLTSIFGPVSEVLIRMFMMLLTVQLDLSLKNVNMLDILILTNWEVPLLLLSKLLDLMTIWFTSIEFNRELLRMRLTKKLRISPKESVLPMTIKNLLTLLSNTILEIVYTLNGQLPILFPMMT